MTNTKIDESVKTAIEIAIKLGLLFIILFVSFLILKPFISIILWSIILAVALYPIVKKTSQKLNISIKKVVVSLSIAVNLALIVPTYMVSDKAITSITQLKDFTNKSTLMIPAPSQKVKEWPLIGKKTYKIWEGASKNFEETIQTFTPEIKNIATRIINTISASLSIILMSMIAIIIASFLMTEAEKYSNFYKKISIRLIGDKGDEWAILTALTIRSVANGVIGVAVIQASLALIGLIIMDVPFSIVIALGVMFLTIIQLPAIIILGPVVAYILSQDTSTMSIAFSIYLIVVGAIDGVLKPMLMGRGVDIPMLIVLIGAIGGMILMGMIGLFIGAVIFSLAYKLFMLWLSEDKEIQQEIQQAS
jgi:predicted PurR-regulated permease PerM